MNGGPLDNRLLIREEEAAVARSFRPDFTGAGKEATTHNKSNKQCVDLRALRTLRARGRLA